MATARRRNGLARRGRPSRSWSRSRSASARATRCARRRRRRHHHDVHLDLDVDVDVTSTTLVAARGVHRRRPSRVRLASSQGAAGTIQSVLQLTNLGGHELPAPRLPRPRAAERNATALATSTVEGQASFTRGGGQRRAAQPARCTAAGHGELHDPVLRDPDRHPDRVPAGRVGRRLPAGLGDVVQPGGELSPCDAGPCTSRRSSARPEPRLAVRVDQRCGRARGRASSSPSPSAMPSRPDLARDQRLDDRRSQRAGERLPDLRADLAAARPPSRCRGAPRCA